ncbi:hypothetical protein AB8I23_004858 [Vibrio alginolyticus]|uniref:hypothetical protein n=2 Tax=Vibrio alginolyticus TaxID=663 RepID=UPI001D79D9E4|nr:hypothetical protein [Vibrio alginolyticus]EJG0483147.1 hypothetical protein [Vibrio alginolyticus]EJL6794292.1 hypothetical protein [Vibrio alginolyticus]EKL9831750.1 hypothetical protein [Vibrio alginolyticus]MCR9492444.1 hypothetical protein [Vibrio alginolyticus]
MSETVITFYKLADFSSLIEVAVGLNLVFSLWEELRHMAVSRFNRISDELSTELKAQLGEKFENSRCASGFEAKRKRYALRLNRFSTFAKWSGLFCTAVMVLNLVFIGFNPDYQVTYYPLCWLLFFAVVFTPLCLITGNLYVSYSASRLDDFRKSQSSAIEDVKQLFENA